MSRQVTALAVLLATGALVPGIAEAQRRPIKLTVDPNIGSLSAPMVRIERVRRASADPKRPGDSTPRPPVDTGLINFEVLIENQGITPYEIDYLRTSYLGQADPMVGAKFGGRASHGLFRDHTAFGSNGTIRASSDQDWTMTTIGAPVDDDYLVAGSALTAGVNRFYVARHNDDKAQPQGDESTPFPGIAFALVAVPSISPPPVFVGGQRGFGEQEQVAVITRYFTGNDAVVLNDGFGDGGVVTIDLPFHHDERILAMAAIFQANQLYVMAVGTADHAYGTDTFMVRMRSDGVLDPAFDGDGLMMLPSGNEPRNPVAIGLRTEPGDIAPSIYLLENVGGYCYDDLTGCHAELSRREWSGASDATFGDDGVATLTFPESASDIPYGLALDPAGPIHVGATRVHKASQAAAIGLTRLTPDGKVDPAFGLFGFRVAYLDATAVAGRTLILRDGVLSVLAKVLYPGAQRAALFRYDTMGAPLSVDASYQPDDEDPTLDDGWLDEQGRFVGIGHEFGRAQLTRFRADGRLDWRGVIDPGEKQRVFWPDDREIASFPTQVKLDVYFLSSLLPSSIAPAVGEDGMKIDLPGQPAGDGLAWVVNQHHRLGDSHRTALNQRYAYDFGMRRHQPASNTWTSLLPGTDTDNLKNSDYLIWGKEARAAADGVVVGCWNTAPGNASPGDKTAYQNTAMPTGGNVVDILHANGSISHYSHLQTGSIPAALCPNSCTDYSSDETDTWKVAGQKSCSEWLAVPGAQVSKGQKLGLIGNSGNSTAPHLHFHVTDAMEGRPVYFDATLTQREVKPEEWWAWAALSGTAAAAPVLDDVANLLWK